MKITALLAAGALALCAAPTTEARLGRQGRSLRVGDLPWPYQPPSYKDEDDLGIRPPPGPGHFRDGDELGIRPPISPPGSFWDGDELGIRPPPILGRSWDDDDNLGRPVSGACYSAQERLCGQCGFENECRLQCNKRNEKELRKACGF